MERLAPAMLRGAQALRKRYEATAQCCEILLCEAPQIALIAEMQPVGKPLLEQSAPEPTARPPPVSDQTSNLPSPLPPAASAVLRQLQGAALGGGTPPAGEGQPHIRNDHHRSKVRMFPPQTAAALPEQRPCACILLSLRPIPGITPLVHHITRSESRSSAIRIRKICGVMAVSFGEAGSEIVANNMRKGLGLDTNVRGRKARMASSFQGSLDVWDGNFRLCCVNGLIRPVGCPLTALPQVAAVFGFVRIVNFDELAEVLQDRVLLLANAVALQARLSSHARLSKTFIIYTLIIAHSFDAHQSTHLLNPYLVWMFPGALGGGHVRGERQPHCRRRIPPGVH